MLSAVRRIFASRALLNSETASRLTSTTIRSSSSDTIEERKVGVDGLEINCVKTGSGPHPVLLLPGALGSVWTDFKPQIEGLDKKKMTVVAWDPPGYGKSRPPDRSFSKKFFKRDADVACGLMKALGFERFSLIGWSDGGITSLVLAAEHPENVKKMVAFGANAYIKPSEIEMYRSISNIDSWSERMRAPMIAMYGEEYFRKTWAEWIKTFIQIYEEDKGDICTECVSRIQCPTLLIHGEKDVMVDAEHVDYLHKNIKNSQMKIFPKGSHNLHMRYAAEFNELVTKFLLQ